MDLMKRLLGTLALLTCLSLPAMAVGTVTQTMTRLGDSTFYILTISWTADAAAATVPATALITTGAGRTTDGFIITQVITNPGSVAPTDNYDITLVDADGFDIMGGALVDRDTANTERAVPAVVNAILPGTVTFTLANNAVNSATGTVMIYLASSNVQPIRAALDLPIMPFEIRAIKQNS